MEKIKVILSYIVIVGFVGAAIYFNLIAPVIQGVAEYGVLGYIIKLIVGIVYFYGALKLIIILTRE